MRFEILFDLNDRSKNRCDIDRNGSALTTAPLGRGNAARTKGSFAVVVDCGTPPGVVVHIVWDAVENERAVCALADGRENE